MKTTRIIAIVAFALFLVLAPVVSGVKIPDTYEPVGPFEVVSLVAEIGKRLDEALATGEYDQYFLFQPME